ncbi:MAG: DUF1553 domain-containing protein [Planctomycetota bacterium]|nr:DUF1553 domain-containing protein [Planctomycetota bacterium]MDA1214070.1 DUF1553 domain-containing protein [Planctomycetota bacterium]
MNWLNIFATYLVFLYPMFVDQVSTFAQDQHSQQPIDFNREIRPILSDNCFICHGPDAATRVSEWRLDRKESAFADLGGYTAIIAGDASNSPLHQRISSNDSEQIMPPADSGKKLTLEQIELIKRWIDQGAEWREHWAYVAPVRPTVPAVIDTSWARQPFDKFILAIIEQEGMKPASEANRETLIRRVTLDLTGLPPTIDEIDEYLADDSPDAYEKVVDRLLGSPRFGERMVIEWLDAARYSDTNGYQTDGTRAMWPWRDWAIEAYNANMPFDQFTIEQLAGDLLTEPTLEQKIATGFNRNHMLNGEGGRIAEESRVDYVVDRVETTSTVWMGLTLGCGRCHDHKYDPFSQKEFYELYAFFNNIDETGAVDRRSSTAAPTIELPTPAQERQINDETKQVEQSQSRLNERSELLKSQQPEWEANVDRQTLPEDIQTILDIASDKRSEEQQQKLTAHFLDSDVERIELTKQLDEARKKLDETKRSVLITMIMEERAEPRETFILDRGAYDKPTEKVERGVPAILPHIPDNEPVNRLGLAKWLMAPSHPLTARVTVNRLWQRIFGLGLVRTPEDFGVQGEPPTHPELLDWLAVQFSSHWDVKLFIRQLVTSATYRQSSYATPEGLDRDPENRLWARGLRFRVNSFTLRDQALAISGLLAERTGGPPVRPYQPPGIWEDFSLGKITYVQDHGPNLYRRSLYTFWRRSVSPTMMFDTSPRQVCTVRQVRTNSPLQSLTLMNDITFVEAARVFAERLMLIPFENDAMRVTHAFRMVTSRQPDDVELQILIGALSRFRNEYHADLPAAEKLVSIGEASRNTSLDIAEHAAMTALSSLLLNLDEALNRE